MENILYGLVIGQVVMLPLARKWEMDFGRMAAAGLAIGVLSGIIVGVLGSFLSLGLTLRLVLIGALVAAGSTFTLLGWLRR